MPGGKQLKRLKEDEKVIQQVNKICLYFSIFMPLTALPQVYMLYSSKDASGLSLLMWVMYTVGVLPFLVYGILHNVKQLVILNTLWLVINAIMISGILMYR